MLKAIAAVDDEFGIGKDEEIPWNYSVDLEFFKFMTTSMRSNKVVFGRSTFENIGVPLPERETYVLTRSESGVKNEDPYLKYTTLEDFLLVDYDVTSGAYICGGQSVYEQTYDKIDELLLTRVKGHFDCDVFFPDFRDDFRLVSDFELRPNLVVQRWRRI